jgi:hypothetical protein
VISQWRAGAVACALTSCGVVQYVHELAVMLSTNARAFPTGLRAFATSQGTMGAAPRGIEMRTLEWIVLKAGEQPPPGVNVMWKDEVTGMFEMQHGIYMV